MESWPLGLLLVAAVATAQSPCLTPSNYQGLCVRISQCQEVVELVNTEPKTPEMVEYLRNVKCGMSGRYVFVCCTLRSQPTTYPTRPTSPVVTPAPTPKPNPPPFTPSGVVDYAKHPNFRLLPAESCGVEAPAERVFGGEITDIFELPWMALLRYRLGGSDAGFLCGGVLISKRYVLTASHCVNGNLQGAELVGVRLGENDLRNASDCINPGTSDQECADPPLDLRIEQKIPHLEYSKNSADQLNDIALLRLAQDAPVTEFIRPICLPFEFDNADVQSGSRLLVAGWGKTETGYQSPVKLKVFVPVFDHDSCRRLFQGRRAIITKQICAGGEEGKDSCNGDSGGPLMSGKYSQTVLDVQYTVLGVVSYGAKFCGTKDLPGVYTSIAPYLGWILDNIRR